MFEHDHDHLTAAEQRDVFEAANAAVEAIDMEPYDDAFMVWHRTATGPQVFIMPLRTRHRQGNTLKDGVLGAYTTREDH